METERRRLLLAAANPRAEKDYQPNSSLLRISSLYHRQAGSKITCGPMPWRRDPDRNRRLSLVYRLGPRYHDLAGRAYPLDRPA